MRKRWWHLGPAHYTNLPCALHVRNPRQRVPQLLFLHQSFCHHPGHKLPGPDWSAQDLDALWTPNFWTQLRNLLRTLASFVPHPCFSFMEANPSHGGQPVAQQVEDGAHPVWQTHHIDIVQERKKQLTVLQMTLDVLQRIVDSMRGSPCSPPSCCSMVCRCPASSSHEYDEGDEYACLTKRSKLWSPGTSRNLDNMVALKTWS